MSLTIKRIQKELKELQNAKQNELPENISAGPVDPSNLFLWEATIIGPTETPYEGGLFKLSIKFPETYPFTPPILKFNTRIFHPNISENGDICLDILKYKWTPAYSLTHVLLSLCSLFSDPNPDDPLNPDAAHLYKRNKAEYIETVQLYTQKFAN
jgi:ubiquitin-conjugating enzyme E2 D/E